MTELKASMVKAARNTFDADYPPDPANADISFANLWVDIEFPVERQHYPSMWVDFDPTKELQIAGIDHREYTDDGHLVLRWRFEGHVTYTILALTSLERDRLFDEMVKVIAFGRDNPDLSTFRSYIESNPLIATDFDWDQIGVTGTAATPGTPWGTDEMIYETTIQMEVVGEFVSDPATAVLVPLSAISLIPYSDREADPGFPD